MKKLSTKDTILVIILFVLLFVIMYVWVKFMHNISTPIVINNGNIEDTNTGAVIEFSGAIETGVIIPENPRELFDYQLEYGEGGKDYIVISPVNQPQINAKTSAENNERMRSYIWNNRIIFDIDTSRQGYIMFITQKPIKNITNIFFGLDGKTIGRLDKKSENRIITEYVNEFLYPLDHIDLIGNNNYRFTAETTGKEKLSINAVVGEDNNKIEKIIIFFR